MSRPAARSAATFHSDQIASAILTDRAPAPAGHYSQAIISRGHVFISGLAEVMDERTELNPWKDFAWPAILGHFGSPWFLPLVGAYYRLKDKLA